MGAVVGCGHPRYVPPPVITPLLAEQIRNGTIGFQLRLCQKSFSAKDTYLLFEALKVNTSLKELDLSRSSLAPGTFPQLFAIIATHNFPLEKLSLCNAGCEVSDLVKFLSRMKSLVKLNLEELIINSQELEILAKSPLRKLYLRNSVDPSDALALLTNLRNNATLEVLDIQQNRLKTTHFGIIGDVLLSNTTLRSLNISRTTIELPGLKLLCNGLSENSSLKFLALELCDLNDDAGVVISQLLQNHNCALEHLDLRRNHFTDKGFVPIAKALEQNQNLNTLKICGNELTEVSGEAMCIVFKQNCSLEKFVFTNMTAMARCMKSFVAAISENPGSSMIRLKCKGDYWKASDDRVSDQLHQLQVQRLENRLHKVKGAHHSPVAGVIDLLKPEIGAHHDSGNSDSLAGHLANLDNEDLPSEDNVQL